MNGQKKNTITLCHGVVLFIQESAVSRSGLVNDEVEAVKCFTTCSSLRCEEEIIFQKELTRYDDNIKTKIHLKMNFTSRGHLPKEIRKHVTSAGDKYIGIFCYFVIEDDTDTNL